MATSTTFLNFMAQLAAEPSLTAIEVENRFVYKFSAATIGNSSLTTLDPNMVKLGTAINPQRFQGMHVYLETAAEERVATTCTLSGSTLTLNFIGGGNATNQAGATNVWLSKVSWTEMRALVNDALELEFVECFIPLNHGPNSADLQDSDTVDTDWNEANATDTVQTTAAEVFMGARSLVVTDSGSGGGYTASTTVRMGHSKQGYAFAIAKSDTGTSALRVVDDGGNTLETVSFTQEDWLLIKKQFRLASDDEGAALRLLESTASAAGDWQFAWIVKDGIRLFELPSWVDERFKLKGIARATFYEQGDEADTWLADSIDLESLMESDTWQKNDFHYINRMGDSHPHRVLLEPHIRLDEPLFLIAEAPWTEPYGVAATYSTDASTSFCPMQVLTARCRLLIADRYPMFSSGREAAARAVGANAGKRKTDTPKKRIEVRRMLG